MKVSFTIVLFNKLPNIEITIRKRFLIIQIKLYPNKQFRILKTQTYYSVIIQQVSRLMAQMELREIIIRNPISLHKLIRITCKLALTCNCIMVITQLPYFLYTIVNTICLYSICVYSCIHVCMILYICVPVLIVNC